MIWRFLVYFIRARHYKGKGIHSPYAYEMARKILYSRPYHPKIQEIEKLRNILLNNNKKLEVEEIGAGSKKLKRTTKKINSIVRYSSVSKKTGRILFNLIKELEPHEIIELGTSFGFSSMYMGIANKEGIIKTIEGSAPVSQFARRNLKIAGITRVEVLNEKFDKILPDILSQRKCKRVFFIDGDHTHDSTVRYVKQCLYHSTRDSVIVIDDINWSREMHEAWKEIVSWNEVRLSFEMFHLGILFMRKDLIKKHYIMRIW